MTIRGPIKTRPTRSGDAEVAGRNLKPALCFTPNIGRNERWLTVSITEGVSRANTVLLADPKIAVMVTPVLGLDDYDGSGSAVFLGFPERAYAPTNHVAERGQLCRSDPTGPFDTEEWTAVIAGDESAVLRDVAIFENEDLDAPLFTATRIKILLVKLALPKRLFPALLPGLVVLDDIGAHVREHRRHA